MFDPDSRYDGIQETERETGSGRRIKYIRRRFVPKADALVSTSEVTVTSDDRLDQVAAATIGDPLLFWRICDANNALHPLELTAVSGRRLRIPTPS